MTPNVFKVGKIIASILVLLTLCGVLSLPARAEPSGYRASLTSQSVERGFEQPNITLLSPMAAPGKRVVADQVRSLSQSGKLGRRLTATDLKRTQENQRVLSYVGETSSLEVYTDGSKFRFRGDIDHLKGTESSATEKMAAPELESLGRSFITNNLGEFVKLGQNETLTFLGTRYLRNGGTDLQNIVKNEVVANIAIFGREVQGLPILGSGSKVALWFGGNKEAIALDVDWPSYKVDRQQQRVLPKDQLQKRVAAISVMPKEVSDVKMSRFECGYVDLGATKRSKRLQPGCSVSYEGRTGPASPSGEKLRWARIEFIPAGAKVLRDPAWPLAEFISRQGEPKPGEVQLKIPTKTQAPGSETIR